MKTKTLLAVAGLAFALAIPSLQARTWTQAASGKKIEAEYGGLDGANVILKVGAKTFSVPAASLSGDDQAFIKEQMAAAAAGSGGGGWPRFRGPNQDDVSPDTGLLKEWPASGPEKVWTYENAGMGYAGYAITGGKLYTTGSRGSELTLMAIDINTGEEVWATDIGMDDGQGYNAGWGGGPRGTPTVAGGKVYALGPKGTLACVNAEDGKKEWSKNLKDDFGGQAGGWGYSESPLVDNGLVIVAPGGGTDSIVALDAESGAKKWGSDISGVGKAEYATILAAEIDGARQYIKFFDTVMAGVNPEDGTVLWRTDWRGRTAVIPTPIVGDNKIYITSGYGAGSKMVQVAGGEATDVWDNTEMKNHHGGVVRVGDHIYGTSDGAGLICQSWETGEMVWNERTIDKGSIHAADGMLYCLRERDGKCFLVEASPEGYKESGQFTLDPQDPDRPRQGKVWTHPVVIDGKLYLRDQKFITAYNVKG